jgi:diaminopimelate epimerase
MKYLKMNGLGNEFVVLRSHERLHLDEAQVLSLHRPQDALGFDQLLSIEPSDKADCFMGIWNQDGSKVAACGNGTRAVAWAMMEETGKDEISIETEAGILYAKKAGDRFVTVDMGEPRLKWNEIPLSEDMQTIRMELQVGPLDKPVLWGPSAVSMGNPHCVFFVENAETAPVKEIGPMIEYHPLFPERTNVGFAQIIDRQTIRLRVWERGVGETRACGTGACAALVAAVRRKLVDNKARLKLNGGDLFIEWRQSDNHVYMTGAVETTGAGDLKI